MSTMMPAAARRIRVFEAGTERIARRRFEDHRPPDRALGDLFLRRRVSGIEAAHEAHLKKRPRLVDGVRHRGAFGEGERRRLLAERRFSRPGGGDDDLPMRMRRGDDDDGVDVAVGNQLFGGAVRLGHVELLGDAVGECPIGVRDGRRRSFRESAPPDRGRRPCRAGPGRRRRPSTGCASSMSWLRARC